MPSVMEQSIGTLTSFSGATNLNSLKDGQAKPFGPVDFSSAPYPNSKLVLGIDFSGVSPVPGGSLALYLMSSLDNNYWSGNINPSGTTDVADYIRNHCKPIGDPIEVNDAMAGTSLVFVVNDVAKYVGDLPAYWCVIGLNNSGCTLPNGGHFFKYESVSYQG